MIADLPAATETRIEERGAVDAETFTREIVNRYAPVVLRGQVAVAAVGRNGTGLFGSR